MNHTLKIRGISMAKNYQCKMKKLKLLVKRPAFNKNVLPIGKDIGILKAGQQYSN